MTRASRRPRRAAALALLLGCFVVYAATTARAFVSTDLWTAHLAAWDIVKTGNPWLAPEQVPSWLVNSPMRGFWILETANGHTVVGRSPGVVAAGLPGYALLGTDTFSTVPGGLTAALLTAVTLTLVFVTWRDRLGGRSTLVVVLLMGFATPVWSMAANGIWPHTVSILGIAGMTWAARSQRWWLVGVFGGIVLWGRLHAAVIVAIVGLYVSWRERDPRVAAKVGVVSGCFLGLLCIWSQWMYGSWSPLASYETSVFADSAAEKLTLVNHLGMWVSPNHGILVWTPLLVLLLPALLRSWRDQSDWAKGLLLAGVIYTLLQASLNRFSGGDFVYGYRLTLELLMCALPAYVGAIPRAGHVARRLIAPLGGLQLAAVLVGAVRDGHYLVPSADSWTDSGYLLAMRQDPLFVGVVTAYCLLVAVLLSRSTWFAGWLAKDFPADGPGSSYASRRGTTSSHSVP